MWSYRMSRTSRCLPSHRILSLLAGSNSSIVNLKSCLSLHRSSLRALSTSPPKYTIRQAVEYLGQPTFASHPHLVTSADELVPGIARAEFKQRRKALAEKFPGKSLVFVSAAARRSSHDTEIRFTQDSTFSYLFGFHEPGAVAVLKENGDFVLFCRKADPDREQWDGPRCGFHRAASAFDAIEAFPLDDLETGVLSNVVGSEAVLVSQDELFKYHIDLTLVKQVERGLADKLKSSFSTDSQTEKKAWRMVLEECDKQRLVKSENELKLIRFAGEVSSFGHMMGMMQAKDCRSERQLQADVEVAFIELGAEGTFFNSIVAGGPRACTLHYTANDQLLTKSELVLVDAGARLMGSGYGGDITRTYPVEGGFGSAERDVYDAVLDVQELVIQSVRSGVTLGELHLKAFDAFSLHLDRLLGKLENLDEQNRRTRKYFPHGISHFLGLDVHDTPTIAKNTPLPVNAVITVEPGLYFPVTDSSVPEHFRGIGVRIEDNVIVGSDRCEIITRRYAPVDPKGLKNK